MHISDIFPYLNLNDLERTLHLKVSIRLNVFTAVLIFTYISVHFVTKKINNKQYKEQKYLIG